MTARPHGTTSKSSNRRPRVVRRGSILIVGMVVIFAIAAMVLSLGRWSRTELLVSANEVASLQASATARGAEQFVLKTLATDRANLHQYTEGKFAAVRTGDGGGVFWIVRPDYGDPKLPRFGLVDESTKLNLNTANVATIEKLPLMTTAVAGSIVDWRDANELPTQSGGAESSTYASKPEPYKSKNANFETPEELLLIDGVTRDLLYGYNALRRPTPTGAPITGSDGDKQAVRANGWFDYVTVWSKSTVQNGNQITTPAGRVAINRAPRAVVKCLSTLTDAETDKLLGDRQRVVSGSTPYVTTWVTPSLGTTNPNRLNNLITGQGLVFSADIVAASNNGRAFKRVRMVVDTAGAWPVVLYRRDITENGWPLDAGILVALRRGDGVRAVGSGSVF